MSGKQFAALFSLIYFSIIVSLLTISDIGSSTEAREVHVARLMLETGEWILPLRNGLLPSKPPIFHWMTAGLGYLTGGVTVFTARLISLIFGTFTLLITIMTAQKFLPEDKAKVSVYTALILGTSYEFMRLATDARVDMVFCFFITVAMVSIINPLSPESLKYSIAEHAHRTRDFVIFYIACAFAVLAKGPLGLVLPGICAFSLTSYYYGPKKNFFLWLRNWQGIVIFLIIAPLWYLLAYEKAGFEFISKQLLFENIERFSGDEFVTGKPFWFYIPSFLRTAFPWSALFIFFVFKELFSKKSSKYKTERVLILIWFFAGFVLFSLSSGKRHAYLVPLYIPMTIFLNLQLYSKDSLKFVFNRNFSELLSLILALLSFFLLISSDILDSSDILMIYTREWFYNHQGVLFFTLLSPFVVRTAFQIFKLKSFYFVEVLTVILLQTVLSVSLLTGQGIKNNFKNFKGAADSINLLVKKDQRLYAIREKHEELLDPILFYIHREAPIVSPKPENLECGSHYLLQEKYLDLNKANFNVKASFTEIDDRKAGKRDKTIVLAYYDCSLSASPRK